MRICSMSGICSAATPAFVGGNVQIHTGAPLIVGFGEYGNWKKVDPYGFWLDLLAGVESTDRHWA